MTGRFWPQAEAAQVDYELLRSAVLAGARPAGVAATRFARRGLAGIVAWPASEPVFQAVLVGGQRERWSPYVDARFDALAAGYALLIADTEGRSQDLKEARI